MRKVPDYLQPILAAEGMPLDVKVTTLTSAGFKPVEIANILDTTPAKVEASLRQQAGAVNAALSTRDFDACLNAGWEGMLRWYESNPQPGKKTLVDFLASQRYKTGKRAGRLRASLTLETGRFLDKPVALIVRIDGLAPSRKAEVKDEGKETKPAKPVKASK